MIDIDKERFSKSSLKVLELAFREALSLGSNQIHPEHLLLALLRSDDRFLFYLIPALDLSVVEMRKVVLDFLALVKEREEAA